MCRSGQPGAPLLSSRARLREPFSEGTTTLPVAMRADSAAGRRKRPVSSRARCDAISTADASMAGTADIREAPLPRVAAETRVTHWHTGHERGWGVQVAQARAPAARRGARGSRTGRAPAVGG